MINGKVLCPDNPVLMGGLIQRSLGLGLRTDCGFKFWHLRLVREKNKEVGQMLEVYRHFFKVLLNR